MPVFEFKKHPSNTKSRKRRGRGTGSSLGKTSGRGQTGQKSRSGGSIPARFEGGRTPAVRKYAKIGGFKHHRKIKYYPVNLGNFEGLPEGTVVDIELLDELSLLPSKLRGLRVKLLGDGEINTKLTFKLDAYSHSARKKVEAAGGTCEEL